MQLYVLCTFYQGQIGIFVDSQTATDLGRVIYGRAL